ncbi:MAG TPA: CCC motif membrane protein [Bacteroidia bacterium]|nr:CCC motif membrane protein [Bacteroidia bacterium]
MDNQNPPFPPPPPSGGNPFQQSSFPNPGPFGTQNDLPNSTAVLVLGIISIVACLCDGLPGLVCGIIALVLAGKANSLYTENPNAWTLKSYNNLKAGRVCAIIGTILSGITMAWVIVELAFFGSALSTMPWQNFH